MKDLVLTDTGGHDEDGTRLAAGTLTVYGYVDEDGEIGLTVTRWGTHVRKYCDAYLSVEQAVKLRKHLKKLIAKAGE